MVNEAAAAGGDKNSSIHGVSKSPVGAISTGGDGRGSAGETGAIGRWSEDGWAWGGISGHGHSPEAAAAGDAQMREHSFNTRNGKVAISRDTVTAEGETVHSSALTSQVLALVSAQLDGVEKRIGAKLLLLENRIRAMEQRR